MRKILSILLTVVLLLTLVACGGKATNGQTGGNADQATDAAGDAGQAQEGFGLTYEEVKLVPGTKFDATKLPEAASVMEVPSCALQGTDNAYNYETFELTAYNEGNGEIVYSIYLLDPNTATDEGLYLGDTMSRAEELYGTDYEKNDTEVIYTAGKTMLILILQDENIISIEYRLAQ